MSTTPSSSPHAELGRYRLEQRIARGGMGEVFRALAVGADGFTKRVVVKRILPDLADDDALVSMFSLEAKLMTRLEHPNIVQVLDFGVGAGGEYFLVMELIEGVDLGRFRRMAHARGERLPLSLVLFITLQMLRGLGHAHRSRPEGHLLVHRDVSPSNVLLSRLGEVKVADFGVALVARAEDAHTPGVVGKPSYMAPEQYRGESLDARADLFSAGVVLFEALTHQLPFEGDAIAERQKRAAAGEVRRIDALRDDLPDGLDAIVRRALAPKRDDRYPDARAMARDLRELASSLALADADDLADAVTDAIEHAPPKLVPVVALGLDAGKPAEDAAATQPGGATHVTRVATIGGFTLEVSEELDDVALAPVPTPAERSRSTPLADASRPRRWSRGSAAIALLLAGGAAALAVLPKPSAQSLRPTLGGVSAIELPAAAPADASAAPAPSASQVDPASAPTAASARSLSSAADRATDAAASAAPGAGPKAPTAPDCFGNVSLFSTSSWQVSGGPNVVQSPGRYRWPCGSYSLQATSRMDASQRRATTVVIREGGSAVFDLR